MALGFVSTIVSIVRVLYPSTVVGLGGRRDRTILMSVIQLTSGVTFYTSTLIVSRTRSSLVGFDYKVQNCSEYCTPKN